MTHPATFQLGRATVTLINICELQADLAGWLNIPAAEWPASYAALRGQKISVPVQCIHVKLPDASLLIDAAVYEAVPDSPLLLPNYQPPPGLTAQLAAVGVQPEAVTDIIITHIHLDHYNGLTRMEQGRPQPTFPHARCYLSRADWETPATQAALRDPESVINRTLGVLYRQGLLTLVEGNLDLGHGIQIIAAPGETSGHQIVRVESAGQTLYGIGDLYHHPIEFERLDWTVQWADVEANRISRQAFVESALPDEARIVATHIPAVYRLRPTAAGVEWVVV
jgi:glyoxylase-like metal-dependent hydrolase (beta-lactamase superfamily II)